jgi:hypothetical protein
MQNFCKATPLPRDSSRHERLAFLPRETVSISSQVSEFKLIDAAEEHTPASTSEVADEVGCTRRNADMRLKKLADDERVERKKIAASQVWTLAKGK